MKSKKLLSILLTGVMVLSMAACGEAGSEGTGETTPKQPENTQVTEASIDFEDGQSGFVMMSTKARKADDSKVSVKDFRDSKALYVENVAGGEMYIGIDVDALLGDKVTEVRSIQMDIGTEYADGSFSASAGNLYAYTGADLKENKLNAWSVYMENKNPKIATFQMEDTDGNPISFTAGNNNYIVLVKDDDTGVVPASMYLDNIAFIDANGNVLAADTSAVMEEPFEGYRKVVEEEPATPAANSTTVALDESYMGDWGQTTTIGADVLGAFAGQDITVTYKFELAAGLDYYLWAPMDAAWTKLGSAMTGLPEKAAADEGDKYHMQADGFIVIDDLTNTELTFTIKAADLDAIIAAGGLSGQTYGVTTFEAVITSAAGSATTAPAQTVALDEAYAGDWGQTTTIGADVLSAFAGSDVTVTYNFELEAGYDYYLWAPMDAAWTKLGSAMTGLPEKAAADEGDKYHMQADGFIVIDDQTNTQLSFTIKAADLDAIIAAGGLSGQTYGVTTFEVVLAGAAPAAPAAATKVALDESYMGDWGQTTTIGADVLSAFAGKDVTVTFSFELEGGYDYYLWAPMDAAWTKLGSAMTGLPEKAAADEGDKYHMQADGFMVIDDQTNTEITFTIKAADLDAIIAAGGLSGQTYGVTVYEAKIQ